MKKMTLFDTLIVVKRSGQRTTFQGEKIAIAIKKAFDSVGGNYKEEDINKVYETVLKTIEKNYALRKTIQIEDIQDLIEVVLQKKNYQDVFLSFQNYREQRNASRKAFVTKQQHKFLKSVEALGFNEKEEGSFQNQKSPNELLAKYGSTIASGVAKSYLLETKVVRAIDAGLLSIPNIEALPLGRIESIELDIGRIIREQIALEENKMPIYNIESFFNFLTLLIKSLAHSVHGQIQISNLDDEVVPFLLATYRETLKAEISSFLTYSGFNTFLSVERIEKEIDKLTFIGSDITSLAAIYGQANLLQIGLQKAVEIAEEKTWNRTQIALKQFLGNMNSIYDKVTKFPSISIGFGTVTSKEARGFLRMLFQLEREENYKEPYYVFKLKTGKNSNVNDPNYDLLKEYLSLATTHSKFLFINIDTKENRIFYRNGDSKTEACCFSDGGRAIEDTTVQDSRVMGGKGNLVTCSINLPRLALKACYEKKEKTEEALFFELLDQSLDLAKEALLSCFEVLCNKHNYHFPLLFGQNIWQDGKNLKETDRLRKVWKHGTLTIHFVGLEEALYALNKKTLDEESHEKQVTKILTHMRKKVDSYRTLYNLNFTLSAKNIEDVCKQFNQIDTAIYGKIKGITMQEAYSNGFQSQLATNTSKTWKDQLTLEKNKHTYTNGGHLSCFQISKKEVSCREEILNTIKKEAIGAFHFQRKD